jgi:hypothetical protein
VWPIGLSQPYFTSVPLGPVESDPEKESFSRLGMTSGATIGSLVGGGSMIIAALLLAAAQLPTVADPITSRIHQICRAQERCVLKQREGMRQFFRLISANPAASQASSGCLSGSAKGWLTNWVKAESCVRKAAKRSVPKAAFAAR